MAAPQNRADRGLERLASSTLTARRAGQYIAVATLAVTIVAAFAIWLLDNEDFPTIGTALWWAVQTVTTVGYGDVVPTTTVGRLIGTIVMLLGIGFVTVVTASITAMFVERARSRLRGEMDDVHAARLEAIDDRLGRIETLLREMG